MATCAVPDAGQRPQLSCRDAMYLAEYQFGIKSYCEPMELDSYDDRNFLITTGTIQVAPSQDATNFAPAN